MDLKLENGGLLITYCSELFHHSEEHNGELTEIKVRIGL